MYRLSIPLVLIVALTSAAVARTATGEAPYFGTWVLSSTSGTIHVDRSTGMFHGSGIGGSQAYIFTPDGRYRLFNYIKQDAGFGASETITEEEGRVEARGDRLTLRPTAGQYRFGQGFKKKVYMRRPMTADDLRKNVRTLLWRYDAAAGALWMGESVGMLARYRREGGAK